MRTILCFLLLTISLSASAQITTSCVPSAELHTAYLDDARYLALQRMYAFRSSDTSLIEIPQHQSDSIMSGFAAICNLDTFYQADYPFRLFCIHEYNKGYSIRVKVDTSYAWTHNWDSLQTETGYGALDSFMQRHGMQVTGWFDISSFEYLNNVATLTADHYINMEAFADSIALFTGVVYTENAIGTVGDGNHIYYTTDTTAHFGFKLAWGDCPAGCTDWRQWNFAVSDTCTVAQEPITGNTTSPSLPTPVYCGIYPAAVEKILRPAVLSVYPNPATTELHVDAGNVTGTYTIIDLYGQLVARGGLTTNTMIDITKLATGVYIVCVNGSYTRFVKM